MDEGPQETVPSFGIRPGLNALLYLVAILPDGRRPDLVLIGQVKPGLIGPGVLAVRRFFLDLQGISFYIKRRSLYPYLGYLGVTLWLERTVEARNHLPHGQLGSSIPSIGRRSTVVRSRETRRGSGG